MQNVKKNPTSHKFKAPHKKPHDDYDYEQEYDDEYEKDSFIDDDDEPDDYLKMKLAKIKARLGAKEQHDIESDESDNMESNYDQIY